MSAAGRPPDCISLEAHGDHDHPVEHGARWVVLALLTAVAVLALANVFGQRHVDLIARSDAATLRVSAPGALRSGLLYQGKFEVEARERLDRPTLVLAHGWWDAMSATASSRSQPRARRPPRHRDRRAERGAPARAGPG